MKDKISYDDFQKLDLVIGKIKSAERVPGTDKLIRLVVDIGEERQIVAGIAQYYSEEDLVGSNIVVLANLEPKKFKGLESKGMLLAADTTKRNPLCVHKGIGCLCCVDGKPILLMP